MLAIRRLGIRRLPCICIGTALVFGSIVSMCFAQLANTPVPSAIPQVQIQQLHQVELGVSGWFAVTISPTEKKLPITLRLRRLAGTGAATFADGSTEVSVEESKDLQVQGVVANDLAGGLSITAWEEGGPDPVATAFFDVVADAPSPRIFFNGRDITDKTESVVVGQRISLNVPQHPSLSVRGESWSIDSPGEYVGGFVHGLLQGGAQPVVRSGPSTTFFWTVPGDHRRVTYSLVLSDGQEVSASTGFDVEGPSYTSMEVPPTEVVIGPSSLHGDSYMSFAGTGISFRAQYALPEESLPNYLWVQLIKRDVVELKRHTSVERCVPKSQPVPDLGSGLDSNYPYDSHNPTRDSPPVELNPAEEEISRAFHARMYLLWGSGLSNSIPVPLGYVDWHFEGQAVRKDVLKNTWILKKGNGGADDPEHPFRATHTYPQWNSLVPYSGSMRCKLR